MRLAVLIVALLPSGSIAAPAPSPFPTRVIDPMAGAPAECPQVYRRAKGERLQPRRLGELPPGELSLTVAREVNGCPEPTVVARGYGAGFEPRQNEGRSRR